MNNLLKKALLFGIGSVSLTRDKVEDLVKDLKKKGQLNEKEGRKLVKDVLGMSLKEQRRIQGIIERAVRETVKGSPVVKRVSKIRKSVGRRVKGRRKKR